MQYYTWRSPLKLDVSPLRCRMIPHCFIQCSQVIESPQKLRVLNGGIILNQIEKWYGQWALLICKVASFFLNLSLLRTPLWVVKLWLACKIQSGWSWVIVVNHSSQKGILHISSPNLKTVLGLDFVLKLRAEFGGCLTLCNEGTTLYSYICLS